MTNTFLAAVLLIGGAFASQTLLAEDCKRVVVTASDGYTNVRSEPRVSSHNLVAAFPSGIVVDLSGDSDGQARPKQWTYVNSPASGWVHNSQITTLDCDAPSGVAPDAASNAIEQLVRQARGGNKNSTASFLAMARGVDGSLAEIYAEEIGAWATRSPETLVAALADQPFEIRRAVRDMVAFSLEGAPLEARGRIRAEIVRQGVDW
jgi:hypothetical protein